MIGARLPRKEDPRLLTGRGTFGDDVACVGQLWARIVRSPVAHGRVLAVDVSEVTGPIRVITAADLPVLHRIPVRLAVDGPSGKKDRELHSLPVLVRALQQASVPFNCSLLHLFQ